ncbi:GGDEF domain-containing protein [Tautonia plasticadhaerens]|uniref:diguanylate cyclase n=1 Tax=Tautonia plasticadhaerens TaxID=2527974 RepID=A0A518HBZ8_9BACT|nr:GGDEF domain-containing protein [Tautonia plasticadhaerens]QDV38216.1 Response regulator PleD [Tautonia plasticadhaerens]
MDMLPVTVQVDSKRPLSRTCKDACLVHIYPAGPCMGMRHVLEKPRIVLGREEGCDISIADSSVSRRHSLIEMGIDGFAATDLDSTNGTYVNNTPANATPMSDGDYLRVGNCLFRFLAGGNVEADYHEELYRLAIIDALTELPNTRHLMDCLERELARAIRYGRPLSLILFDIDHFKEINDTLGHLAGDLTLRELAGRLRGEVCEDGLLARYGGEEFAVVLIETGLERAVEVAERLRRAVAEHEFRFEGTPYAVRVSLGVATLRSGEPLTPKEFIQQADECLYRAKRRGRDCVVSP